MSGRTISIHSYRGGTGKSNVTANVAYRLAATGKKVAVVDTDIQSPGIHMLLGIPDPGDMTLNDFLFGQAEMKQVARDVSEQAGLPAESLYLIPSSVEMIAITRVIKQGYDVNTLNRGFRQARSELELDYLLIDTHPGLQEETLLSLAISDVLILLLRPDQQDFQGTSVTVEVARRLGLENILLVLNKVLPAQDSEALRSRVESTYGASLTAVLPLTEKLIELGSAGLFTRLQPDEAWSRGIGDIADRIVESDG